MVMRIVGIIVALIAAIPAVFIAQLYSPAVMWILSFALLLASPLIAFVEDRKLRTLACVAVSAIINMNYLLHIPYGNPPYEIALYGVALLVFDFVLILVIANLTRSLRKSKRSGSNF